MKRSIKDIMNQMVTLKYGSTGYALGRYYQKDYRLGECLYIIPEKLKTEVAEIRACEYHSEEYKVLKSRMPMFYIAGIFPQYNIADKAVMNPTCLMTLDIDAKDNPDKTLEEIRSIMFSFNWVACVLRSIGGRGLFCVVPISDWRKYTEYYNYLKDMLLKSYGIILDPLCVNIARGRIISYDEDAIQWTKKGDVTVWDLYDDSEPPVFHVDKKVEKLLYTTPTPKNFSNDINIDNLRDAIWRVLNSGYTVASYGAWYHVGCEFANFSDGLEMFQKLSDNWGKQSRSVESKWKECIKNPASLKDVAIKWFGMAKKLM